MATGRAWGEAAAIEADVPRFESGCYQFTILRPAQELPPLRLFRLEGGTTDLSALRGKPILLNFWASWCAACRMESPALDRLYRDAWRGRVHVAAVSLDEDHIERLRHLRRRYKPRLFSEHLAWSSHDAGFLNDLLPVPYTAETLKRVVEHIDQVQTALGCEMLLENPSTYVAFAESTYAETDFIAEVARRTGCGLLLDVNNVFVASTNQQWDPVAYIEGYSLASVREIHLAGNDRQADEAGRPLLIDTHDRPVEDAVWHLYKLAVRLVGPVPTLIEWDAQVPAWSTLAAEAERAETIMSANRLERRRAVAC